MRRSLLALSVAFLFALAVPRLAEAQIYVDNGATGAGEAPGTA